MFKKLLAILQAIALALLPIISPGLTFLCGTQVPSSKGAIKVGYITLGVMSAIAAPWFARISRKRERRNAVIKNEAVISAVADEMGSLVTRPEERTGRLARIQDRLTTCAAQHAGSKARAAFFTVETRRRLRLATYHNRDTPPRQLERMQEEGLVNAMNGKEIVYVKDTMNTDGNLSFNLGDSYRSAIIAPVYAGNEPQGVLVIDAPEAKRLTKKHVRESYVRALTHLLGTAHAMGNGVHVNKNGVPRQPDGRQGGKATPSQGKDS
ncbi:GAF domain-containing protein [Streptomyces sp. NPDC051243]|uniref:GAF domain-containing protein n=1 Tax=Streptomyces sp. NPDC051243 TaxID=3365646 RepID=UPI00379163D1